MSRFEFDVLTAQTKKNKQRLVLFIVLLLVSSSIIFYAVFFKQTELNILPPEISEKNTINVSRGVGVVLGGRLFSLSSNVELTVSAAGFQDKAWPLKEGQLGIQQIIELEPALSILQFSATPPQKAKWFINGAFIAEGPNLNYQMLAGTHELTVISLTGMEQTSTFQVGRGEVLSKTFEFPTISGTIEIETPKGSQVFVNEIETIKRRLALVGGVHEIKVTKDGYFPLFDTIEVTQNDQIIKRKYSLNPKSVLVSFAVTPPGGVLTINGVKINFADEKQFETPYRDRLVVEYSKEGFQVAKTIFQPKPGDSISFDANLVPETGFLKITGTEKASVKVNGIERGEIPLELKLPTKEYTVSVTKTGYKSQEKVISVRPDRNQSIEANLIPISEGRKNITGPSYTSQFGLKFIYIPAKNKTFQMGGKRSENGQRANEIIRNIKFSKGFYVASTELTRGQFGLSGDLPVTNIAWIDVAKFCNLASRNEELDPFYRITGNTVTGYNQNANGYRLITEAEWEFLARRYDRATQTKFVWGDTEKVPVGAGNLGDQNSRASLSMFIPGYNDNFKGLAPVRSFAPNVEELYDLVGNASEWVNDSYIINPNTRGEIEIDPLGGPPQSKMKTVKGSSFMSASMSELRAAFREGTGDARPELGFRLARYR